VSDELEDLYEQLREIDRERAVLTDCIDALKVMKAPHQIGDIVEVLDRGEWREAIVRYVEPSASRASYYRVSFREKNGEWGNIFCTVGVDGNNVRARS
jgi:hypothetical protein